MRRREIGDRGAAAVEFALVVPVLLLLLFGMIDYGLYFSNRLAVQQGAHDGAREAAIGQTSGDSTCDRQWAVEPNENGKKIACAVVDRTEPVVGEAYVKIKVPAGGWAQGEAFTVCEMVKTDGLTGFVPMPGNGLVSAKVVMSIEQDVDPRPSAGEETPPTGEDWSWC